jgi:hypothetical protein
VHDRRQSGQKPTVVVDAPTVPNLSIENLGIGVDGRTIDTTCDHNEHGDHSDHGETCAPAPEEPESLLARRAKLIALLLAALALVGSMVVASMLADDDADDSSLGPPTVAGVEDGSPRPDVTPEKVVARAGVGDGPRSSVHHATPPPRPTL